MRVLGTLLVQIKGTRGRGGVFFFPDAAKLLFKGLPAFLFLFLQFALEGGDVSLGFLFFLFQALDGLGEFVSGILSFV